MSWLYNTIELHFTQSILSNAQQLQQATQALFATQTNLNATDASILSTQEQLNTLVPSSSVSDWASDAFNDYLIFLICCEFFPLAMLLILLKNVVQFSFKTPSLLGCDLNESEQADILAVTRRYNISVDFNGVH